MSSNQLARLQILIVDDEKNIQRLVYDVLASLGFRDITVANSGRKAIEFLSQRKFDFVITDWRMGDLDGIDIVRFVRTSPESQNRIMPIIMLTGNTEAHYVLTARAAGVNGYLLKPFSAEQLVRRIRVVIEQPAEFVIAPSYCGPDRRHVEKPPPNNDERRKRRKNNNKDAGKTP